MPSVSLQGNSVGLGNPYIVDVGKANSDAVIINSGQGNPGAASYIWYQIRRKDQTAFDGVDGHTTIDIVSTGSTSELVKSVNWSQLEIVLPFRTDFQVRTKRAGQAWSAWTNFKTRDKTYALPDAITELRVNKRATSRGETVSVTNQGKATVTNTNRGATVVNNDQNDNESMYNNFAFDGGRRRARGRYIKTKTYVQNTATGARVTSHKNARSYG